MDNFICRSDPEEQIKTEIRENGDHKPEETAIEAPGKPADRETSKFNREPKNNDDSDESNDELWNSIVCWTFFMTL